MALALNTSHPLYAHLKLLVCVDDDGSVKDLVTPSRTVTLSTGVTVGSGAYGRHVKTLQGANGYTPLQVSWTPLEVTRTGAAFVVVNNITALEGTDAGRLTLAGTAGTKNMLLVPAALAADGTLVGRANNAGGTSTATPAVAGSILSQGALSLATGFDMSVGAKVWKNGVLGVTAPTFETGPELGNIASAGGRNTQGVFAAEFVWIAIFDRILTDTEVADLHGSLDASNTFALVDSGASSTPVAFSSSVSNQTGTEGTAFSLDLSTYFSGTETPFAYSVQSGTLPAGLSLNASTGVISGTPTTAGVSSGIVIRVTDAESNTADTNAFSITINVAGDVEPPTLTGSVTFTSITQTSYTAQWPAGLDNVAITGYEYQIGSTAGAWTDAGNNLSAAITGRTAGTTETVYVRAYDAAGLRSTPAISGSVTLLSASTDGTITVGSALYPIKYSSASVLNESGLRATVLDATTLAQVLNTSGVVCTNGVITITDAALVIGNTYHLAVKTANGWLGVSDGVTAS